MEKELDEVISVMKAVILPVKGGLAFNRLSREYYEMMGAQIPYAKHGFPTLLAFVQSIPQIRISNDHQQMLSIHDPKTAHLSKMVSAQKSNKKRPSMKVGKFGSGSSMGGGSRYGTRPSAGPFAPRFGGGGQSYGFPTRKPPPAYQMRRPPLLSRPHPLPIAGPTMVYVGGKLVGAEPPAPSQTYLGGNLPSRPPPRSCPAKLTPSSPAKGAAPKLKVGPLKPRPSQVYVGGQLVSESEPSAGVKRESVPGSTKRLPFTPSVKASFSTSREAQDLLSTFSSYREINPTGESGNRTAFSSVAGETDQVSQRSVEPATRPSQVNKPTAEIALDSKMSCKMFAAERLQTFQMALEASSKTETGFIEEALRKTSLNPSVSTARPYDARPMPGRWGIAVDEHRRPSRKTSSRVSDATQRAAAAGDTEQVNYRRGRGDAAADSHHLTKTITRAANGRGPAMQDGAGDTDCEKTRVPHDGGRLAAEDARPPSPQCGLPVPRGANSYFAKHYNWFAGAGASGQRNGSAAVDERNGRGDQTASTGVNDRLLRYRRPQLAEEIENVPDTDNSRLQPQGASVANLSEVAPAESARPVRSPVQRSVAISSNSLTVSVVNENATAEQRASPDIEIVYENLTAEQRASPNIEIVYEKTSAEKENEWELESLKLLLKPKYVDSLLIGDNFFLLLCQDKLRAKCVSIEGNVFRCGYCVSGLTIPDCVQEVMQEKVMTDQVVIMLGAIDILMDQSLYELKRGMVRLMEMLMDKFQVRRVVLCTVPTLLTAAGQQIHEQEQFNDWLRHYCAGSNFFYCCDLDEKFTTADGYVNEDLYQRESLGVELGTDESKVVDLLLWNEKGYEVVLNELRKCLERPLKKK